MEPKPWRCPGCDAWIPPHVTAHRCDEPGTGAAAPRLPMPPSIPVSGGTTAHFCAICGQMALVGQPHDCKPLVMPFQSGTRLLHYGDLRCSHCHKTLAPGEQHTCVVSVDVQANTVTLATVEAFKGPGGALYNA